TDGSKEMVRIPAEIWRRNNKAVSKLLIVEKSIASLTIDPRLETADVDLENNHWPPKTVRSRFELFKQKRGSNPMRETKNAQEKKDKKKEAGKGGAARKSKATKETES
ncbi:MAG: aminopeptidase, partial [Planctomycetota bacterium]